MADIAGDYIIRAQQAREAAAAEPLENMRARHIASAEAWDALARKASLTAFRRAERDRQSADAQSADDGDI